MKILILISLFIFISCEEQVATEEVASTPDERKTIIVNPSVDFIEIEYINGTYKSECVDSSYYMIYINNYEVEIAKFKTNNTCEIMKSFTTATYNINGNSLDYVETDFVYFSNSGGTYICGETQMVSGSHFNIDGINCSESFENVTNVLSVNDSEQYVVNGIVFDEI